MEENKFNEEKETEEKNHVESIESNVFNPDNKEETKQYYKTMFRHHKLFINILRFTFAMLFFIVLLTAFFYRPDIFVVLLLGMTIVGAIVGFITIAIGNAIQEKHKKFMSKNIDQLKEYKAKIVMITAFATLKTINKKVAAGLKMYCEVNGKVYSRLIDGNHNYSKDTEIKVYMHDKIKNFFLTEEEYLHAKMQLENK